MKEFEYINQSLAVSRSSGEILNANQAKLKVMEMGAYDLFGIE